MMLNKVSKASPLLTNLPIRQFSIVAPTGKLHFIDHPRYGSVYPVVSINDKQIYFRLAKFACFASSTLNTSIIYSLFVNPIFVPAITAVICNPMFVIPSLFVNYALYQRYYIYFFNRSFVTNMFLKPNGKQVIVETLDGESKVVNNKDFYKAEPITNKFQHRIDIYHGANNYLFLRGNSYSFNSHILSAIVANNFIDVRNVAYDYDVTKEFTWDFKELVEIKKRKRRVNRFYKPNLSLLQRLQSADKFDTNKRQGTLRQSRAILKGFEVFNFQPDQYQNKEDQSKLKEKQDLYLNYAGSKLLKTLEQKHKGNTKESHGRRVKVLQRSKSAESAKN